MTVILKYKINGGEATLHVLWMAIMISIGN